MGVKKNWFLVSCVFLCAVFWGMACDTKAPMEPVPQVQFRGANQFPNQGKPSYQKNYRFTRNMFTQRRHLFMQAMAKYRGKPDVHYLEIGVHEGRALLWVLENVLTDPSSTLTGIDLFDAGEGTFKPTEEYGNPQEFKRTFFDNVRKSGHRERIRSYIGYSQNELPKLPSNSFDIIYIDGCHSEVCAREDAKQSWRVLKEGGRILFDDHSKRDYPGVYQAAMELYNTHKSNMKVVHNGRILVVEKVSSK